MSVQAHENSIARDCDKRQQYAADQENNENKASSGKVIAMHLSAKTTEGKHTQFVRNYTCNGTP